MFIHKSFKINGESFSSIDELILFSEGVSNEIAQFLKEWFNLEPFVEVKTSGSTGTPKIIQLQKALMINSAKATGAYFNIKENAKVLLCMSPNFIAGKMMLVRALTLGWHLDVVSATSNPLKTIKKVYDFSAMVPLQLHNSLPQINKIKKLIVGGGVVSEKLLNQLQVIKTNVYATYGMTETITHIAVKKLNNFEEKKLNLKGEFNYKTLPNITVSKDYRGCLVINAPKVANELVITNDLVELISETEFKWLGRFDTIINSGGVKLIPEQIEEKLASIIQKRFFITGISDPILGEKLILLVEGKNDISLESKLKKKTLLSKYEKPKEIYFINAFIETPTSKINRVETMKLLKNIY
ncbi:AMP-binding protein [uncultured Lutibacter sp.]|uniref:AMP-binding protein n=1 Tax=uncultured Lutibacter sp. TaxID=437739 RepID=UPI002635EE4A|nr:AMP-binding protein [uncultured Lutibacter sp.]